MNRLAVSVLLIALVVTTLGWLTCAGDPPEMLVDATPAAVETCPKLVNPCDRIDCDKPVKGYVA